MNRQVARSLTVNRASFAKMQEWLQFQAPVTIVWIKKRCLMSSLSRIGFSAIRKLETSVELITLSTTTATGITPAAKTQRGTIASGMAPAVTMKVAVMQTTRKGTSLATLQATLMA